MESRLHISINRNNKFPKYMIFLKTDSVLVYKKNWIIPSSDFINGIIAVCKR